MVRFGMPRGSRSECGLAFSMAPAGRGTRAFMIAESSQVSLDCSLMWPGSTGRTEMEPTVRRPLRSLIVESGQSVARFHLLDGGVTAMIAVFG